MLLMVGDLAASSIASGSSAPGLPSRALPVLGRDARRPRVRAPLVLSTGAMQSCADDRNQIAMKRISPIDEHVGTRVRTRRLMLNMSQSEVANGLGLTFQQLQKYEKGVNRISASRLQLLCTILKVPVSFFFEGAPPAHGLPDAPETETDGEAAALNRVLATSDGVTLAVAFGRIGNVDVRRAIVALVEQIAAEPESVP